MLDFWAVYVNHGKTMVNHGKPSPEKSMMNHAQAWGSLPSGKLT